MRILDSEDSAGTAVEGTIKSFHKEGSWLWGGRKRVAVIQLSKEFNGLSTVVVPKSSIENQPWVWNPLLIASREVVRSQKMVGRNVTGFVYYSEGSSANENGEIRQTADGEEAQVYSAGRRWTLG